MIRRLALLPAMVAMVAAMAACGVPVDAEPRVVDTQGGAYPGLAPAAPDRPGAVSERLCLVRNDLLTAVTRSVQQPVPLDTHLQLLLDGPTQAERDTGYTTALTGTTPVQRISQARGIVTLEIGDRPDDTGRSDEVLAFGQIVCTLTTRPDVAAVAFTHDGQRLGVPRADGSLSPGPLTAADYAELLAPP
jgi:hypothetical protein